jgi:Cdc6-like AAA superfamily ATPase
MVKKPSHKATECPSTHHFHSGKANFDDKKPLLSACPPPTKLYGLEKSAGQLMDDFFSRKTSNYVLCTVHGAMGTGKSALVQHVGQLVKERVLLEGGFVFVACRGVGDYYELLE